MANYKESSISGTSWTRSNTVVIANPYNGIPSISFREEEIFSIGEENVTRPIPESMINPLIEYLSDQSTEFDLIHPETDEVIGVAHYMDIYVMLYSMYRRLSTRRDNFPIITPSGPTPPNTPTTPTDPEVPPADPEVPPTDPESV